MKYTLSILLCFFLFACKKEASTRYYNKYDVSFDVRTNVDSACIQYLDGSQQLRKWTIQKGDSGLSYMFGEMESGKKLFVAFSTDTSKRGYCKIIFNYKDVVLKRDSFHLDSIQNTCSSQYVLN